MKISDMTKNELKNTPFFHMVNPDELEGITDYATWLEAILHNPCNVWEENGELFLIEIRQLVARVNGLKIEIYSNEHPPPHFHVKSPNVNASFTIDNCELLEGKAGNRDLKKIKYWHSYSKDLLIEQWDTTRPTNCQVGAYIEP
ncbi:MAG: DUF4160 domain-containing protein [Gammaproteobacteria bacterium]|nr:DUF4160 domain-containing protein [Gammaproteobacteria bacterium]